MVTMFVLILFGAPRVERIPDFVSLEACERAKPRVERLFRPGLPPQAGLILRCERD